MVNIQSKRKEKTTPKIIKMGKGEIKGEREKKEIRDRNEGWKEMWKEKEMRG